MTALVEQKSVELSAMTVPQLTSAYRSLDECQQRYDKLSGIVAVMKGIVLTEVKHKCGHGNFLPWLADNFPKHRSVAAQDMRLAGEFCKCRPTSTFEILGRDLATTLKEIEQAQLDLKHPLVREVASFVGERTRYQLLLDFPTERGGARPHHGRNGKYDPNSPAEIACDLWLPIIEKLEHEGLEEKSWRNLPRKELNRLRDVLVDLKLAMKK